MLDHFDLLAPVYDRMIGPADTGRMVKLLRLPTSGRLLDAGGGTGRVSSRLSPMVGSVVVSDLSRRMLGAAPKEGVSPVQAHAERLPFADGTFDRVLVVDALHHFCDQQEAVKDLLRVLRPGGRLVIEEPDLNHLGVRILALMEKVFLMRSHFHSPEEIRGMIRLCGCEARVEDDHPYKAWVVADK